MVAFKPTQLTTHNNTSNATEVVTPVLVSTHKVFLFLRGRRSDSSNISNHFIFIGFVRSHVGGLVQNMNKNKMKITWC